MNAPKLTPWFDAGTKPTLPGVYETDAFHSINGAYQRWDGEKWHAYTCTPESADRQAAASLFQNVKWRGLKEQPK